MQNVLRISVMYVMSGGRIFV